MSYIDKSLGTGETVIARAHFHWLYNLSAWLQLLVPAIVFVVVLSWAGEQPNFMTTGNPMTWLVAVVALWLLLGVIAFLRMMIRKWTTEIGVTSHRFVEKYGALAMRTNEIALPNIEGVQVNQGLLGRMLRLWHGADRRHRRRRGDHARLSPIRWVLCAPSRPPGSMWRSVSSANGRRAARPLRQAWRRRGEKQNRHAGARAPRAVEMHAAAMQFDKRLGQRQAQPGAFIAALQPVIDLAEGFQCDV